MSGGAELIDMQERVEILRKKASGLNVQGDDDTLADMDRSQISDMIAASEAKTDVKFEKVLSEMRVLSATTTGKIDTLSAKVDSRPTTFQAMSWLVGVAIAIIGAIIAAANLIVRAVG